MYLKELKKELGKDADVRLDTMVLKFNPNKKFMQIKKVRKLNFSFFFSL